MPLEVGGDDTERKTSRNALEWETLLNEENIDQLLSQMRLHEHRAKRPFMSDTEGEETSRNFEMLLSLIELNDKGFLTMSFNVNNVYKAIEFAADGEVEYSVTDFFRRVIEVVYHIVLNKNLADQMSIKADFQQELEEATNSAFGMFLPENATNPPLTLDEVSTCLQSYKARLNFQYSTEKMKGFRTFVKGQGLSPAYDNVVTQSGMYKILVEVNLGLALVNAIGNRDVDSQQLSKILSDIQMAFLVSKGMAVTFDVLQISVKYIVCMELNATTEKKYLAMLKKDVFEQKNLLEQKIAENNELCKDVKRLEGVNAQFTQLIHGLNSKKQLLQDELDAVHFQINNSRMLFVAGLEGAGPSVGQCLSVAEEPKADADMTKDHIATTPSSPVQSPRAAGSTFVEPRFNFKDAQGDVPMPLGEEIAPDESTGRRTSPGNIGAKGGIRKLNRSDINLSNVLPNKRR